ncbi:MAP3K12-binding inhibitory protein 1 [Trichonephila clavata]|uniref:MAP3K12-binding inhibitory protein 1 n=1 Tax=Trichonephila clavata TaxID=2740835 RepID=A0A8X6K670_TRICU|nr:MAP3K12-binding inhibitory protein 1 [Trichonephila clavata]
MWRYLIAALESLLKELQCIGVIKEFNLQSLEHNPANLNKFVSAFSELNQVSESVKNSDKKTVGDSSQNIQKVSDMNCDQAENKNCNSYAVDNVQIRVSSEEMRRRIKAFKLGRRRLKDERNVQEYCGHPYTDEHHPLWGDINTCARVDAVFIPKYDGKSRVKVSRVRNVWGPQTQAVVQEADNESDRLERVSTEFIAIEERLSNMELHLKLKKDSTVKKNVFQRLKEVEDRILYLEGTSPEFFISPVS